MSQTRDQQRQHFAGAQMREEGMPQGQAPAPMSPRQRSAHVANNAVQVGMENMIADVENNRAQIVQFLTPFGIDFDFFLAGLRILLMRLAQDEKQKDFFIKVSPASIMEALFRCAKDGLTPDGKEAAIGHFNGVATYMPMRDGFVKVLWRTGMIKSINDNVVTEAEEAEGRFEYVEGTGGYVKHRPSMKRTDADESIAAYCVVQLITGGEIREVVTQDELRKIRKMSKSPARGAWKFQMDRKAAIRRVMGKMPKEKASEAAIAQLLAHDDMNYDLTKVGATPAAIPAPVATENLFSGRVAAPAKRQAAQPEPQDEDLDDGIIEGQIEPKGPSDAVQAVVDQMRAADSMVDLGGIITDAQGRLHDITAEERELLENVAAECEQKLSGFRGKIVFTHGGEVDEFTVPGVWRQAYFEKMSALTGAPLLGFWKANLAYVQEAGEHGWVEAEAILEDAEARGLPSGFDQ